MESRSSISTISALVLAATLAVSANANAAFNVSTIGGNAALFDGDSFDFSWNNTPYETDNSITFSANQSFTLTLNSYDDATNESNNTSQVTGFFLYNVTESQLLTSDYSFCPDKFITGVTGCNLITESAGTTSFSASKPGDVLFTNLIAGDQYQLGIFDSASPEAGSASIGISAVPLPAAAWMFLTAIAGFGFLANRKRKA